MSEHYDCIVLGIGGFGSGTIYHLAKHGLNVLGLEQFSFAHQRGSSHGETRIIRKAYFEHPNYVPLLESAYRQWEELELETGKKLVEFCGLMLSGPEEGEAISGAKLSAEKYNVAIEEVSPRDARKRFVGFEFPDDYSIVYEPAAGFLRVEECVKAHVECAISTGATVRFAECVRSWESNGRTVTVTTDSQTYRADSLIITAGAWTSQLLEQLSIDLTVLKKPVFWFETIGDDYSLTQGTPGFYFEVPDGSFYGFPAIDGQTVKVGKHSGGIKIENPTTRDSDVTPEEIQSVENFVTHSLPQLKTPFVRHSVCMYTMTDDGHFIIDQHPEFSNVVIGAGFSGHGFKFTNVLGDAMCNLVLDGKTDYPIDFLSLDRF